VNVPAVADQLFEVIRTRRVVRSFTAEPVGDDLLWRVVQAARWATSGGNRHVHKFLITRDPIRIGLIRSFSPGMLVPPPAIVIILTDHEVAAREMLQMEGDYANWVDVGTAAQNMMNMAHALGLGSCPVTSFSKSGVATVLDLPQHLVPELLLMVGHPKPADRGLKGSAPKPVTARDLTYWEDVGRHDPD
jgi:nitroreductase